MVTGSGGKILVVEDDDGMREAVETLLDAANSRDRRLPVSGGVFFWHPRDGCTVCHHRSQAAGHAVRLADQVADA